MSANLGVSLAVLGLLLPARALAAAGDIWTFDPGSFSTSVADSGLWVGPFDLSPTTPIGPYNPVHAALFSHGDSGKVVLWRDTLFMFFDLNVADSRTDVDIASQDDWDVVHHSFCSGHAFFEGSSGASKLLVAGGDYFVPNEVDPASQNLLCHDPAGGECFPDSWTSIIDPSDNSVTLTNDFNSPPRWYPTLVTLPTGEVLMAAGDYWDPTKDEAIEEPPNPERGLYDNGEVSPVFEWERFDPTTEQWSLQGELLGPSVQVKNYGFFQVLPKGLFFEGPRAIVPSMSSAFVFPWPATTYDNTNWLVTTRQSAHPGGSAVLLTLEPPYTSSVVMMMGGGTDCKPSDFVQRKDPTITVPPPGTWMQADRMNRRRTHLNAVLLPDGTVFAVGGADSLPNSAGACSSNVPVLPCELFDPEANGGPGSSGGGEWSLVKSLLKPRMYHSIALLLPDARVLSAGNQGGPSYGNTATGDTCEIYYPPYLFNAAGTALATRPNITSAPAQVHYGLPFEIEVDVAGDAITEVTLHRPSSVTHSNDMTQRRVALEFAVVDTAGGQIFATAPWQPEIASPGDYMLFVLQDGVPSHAKFVKLSRATSTSQTGSETLWGGKARMDRDFKVESGHTLTILPGTTVYFAPVDSQNVGVDADRIEILVAGQLLAEGEIDDRIVFTSSAGSPDEGDWHGVTFQDAADMRLSNVEYADFEYPVFAIGVDSLSGNILNCSFTGSQSGDIRVRGDTRIAGGFEWNLDAPVQVVVDAAVQDSVEILVDGALRTQSAAPGTDWVTFTVVSPSQAGNDWHGITVRDYGAGEFYDADVGHATNPVTFLGLWNDEAIVSRCSIHHYSGVGILDWASAALIESTTVVHSLSLGAEAETGIQIESSPAIVRDNVVGSHEKFGILAEYSSGLCTAPPPSAPLETVRIVRNEVVGAGEQAQSSQRGITVKWICHNVAAVIKENNVQEWGGTGVRLLGTTDTDVSCNCIVDNGWGVRYQTKAGTVPAADGITDLFQNKLDSNFDFNVRVDQGHGLSLGDGVTVGKNSIRLGDGPSPISVAITHYDDIDVEAQTNTWFDTAGNLLATQAAIDATNAGIIGQVIATNFLTSEQLCTFNSGGCALSPSTVAALQSAAEREGRPSPGAGDAGVGTATTGEGLPESLSLGEIRPNPAKRTVSIALDVPSGLREPLGLRVYDVTGRLVRELAEASPPPGRHRITWDGRDGGGRVAAPGVYFVSLASGSFRETRKVTLVR